MAPSLPLVDLGPLNDALANDALILTANQRQARAILDAHGREQQQQGQRAWNNPRVMALDAWLNEQWQGLQDQAAPGTAALWLSPAQELYLWEQVISADPISDSLLRPLELARLAMNAYQTLLRWQQPLSVLTGEERGAPLLTWTQAFNARCQQHHWITRGAVQGRVLTAYQEGELAQEPALALFGFDDLPPLDQALFAALSPQQQVCAPAPVAGEARRLACADADEELAMAAAWIAQVLEREPDASIGLIVPDLPRRRAAVMHALRQHLEPGLWHPDQDRSPPPINISAGEPLADLPLIHCALTLLQWTQRPLTQDQVCALLQQPFWGQWPQDLPQRNRLVQRLRASGRGEWTLSQVLALAEPAEGDSPTGAEGHNADSETAAPETATGDAPPISLHSRLAQLLHHQRRWPDRDSPAAWASRCHHHLRDWGWPGARSLDSIDYQQHQHWLDTLARCGQLDPLQRPQPASEALAQLQRLCREQPFQAQTVSGPLQVLGPLEGAGLRFSHCWVLGLHHQQWPPPPAPNPLLPLALQRRAAMPHADADRELRFARQLTEHYRQCAPTVMFSHPSRDGDAELAPSPLLRGLPQADPATLVSDARAPFYRGRDDQSDHHAGQPLIAPWETLADHRAPALSPDPDQPQRGGQRILADQAACPFDAVAIHRLGVRAPEPISPGLTPAQRGSLLHHLLDALWYSLGDDQATLLALSDDAEQRLLERLIAEALRPLQQAVPDALGPRGWAVEAQRLRQLLTTWLALERERPPFTVLAREQTLHLAPAGLPLKVRLDRLDRLADGSILLIDYKTGNPKLADWAGERLREPQLPLYSLSSATPSQPQAAAQPLQAVAFARLHVDGCRLLGLSADASPAPGIKPLAAAVNDRRSKLALPETWDALLDHWRRALETLAAEFIGGDAAVVYRDRASADRQRWLWPLNRHPEARNAFAGAAADATSPEREP